MSRDRSANAADRNWRLFVWFRVFFNSRFYYPVLAVFFLDLGLSATEYTLLNFAWALAIVFVDLPAGALADRLGRKPLVVAAAAAMVIEMLLLCVAPQNGGRVLLLCCLANRLLSGAAEGMASGADEALVFDSLRERGRQSEWPQVLEQVMKWQSVGMVTAMLIGGAVYDPGFVNRALLGLGWAANLDQSSTLRFPIYLNLLTAVATLMMAVAMKEPARAAARRSENGGTESARRESPWAAALATGRWIAHHPVALFVILAGVAVDSVIRLFLTFSSSYFRLIDLPAASYGLIGAGLGAIGFAVAPMARRMALRGSVAGNFVLLAAVTIVGLAGLALRWRLWGLLWLLPLDAAMMALGYLVSYYLNALVDSERRATALSFKGLAFNLGYGFVSLLFAAALRALRDGARNAEEVFGRTLPWLPLYLVLTLMVIALFFWRQAGVLRRTISTANELGAGASDELAN